MKGRQLKSSNKGSLHLPRHVYLAYLLVCTFLLTGVSVSCYISSANGSDSARVAAGVVTVSYHDNTTVEMSRDGEDSLQTKDFSFSVSNEQSEVAIRYHLAVKLDQPLPSGVTICLYKNDGTEPICTFDNKSGTQFTTPDAGVFEAGGQETDQYKLTFEGNFYYIEGNYKGKVSISVQAEQID